MTLVFLGEISTDRLAAVREAMDSVNIPPFFLHVGGFGYFRRNGGDIFWAGVEKSKPLMRLYHQTSAQLQNRGFQLEKRAYCPHLTLARQAILKQKYNHSAFVVPTMKMLVDKITLFQSERQFGKLRYTPVYERFLLLGEEI
ncbi:MAG: hypothetical protein ACFWUC_01610 [Oscillospiraceae bacterium]